MDATLMKFSWRFYSAVNMMLAGKKILRVGDKKIFEKFNLANSMKKMIIHPHVVAPYERMDLFI